MQECNGIISEAGKKALGRIAGGQHLDRHNGARVSKCYDESAKRAVSFSALQPNKSAKPPRKTGEARR